MFHGELSGTTRGCIKTVDGLYHYLPPSGLLEDRGWLIGSAIFLQSNKVRE